MKRIRVFAPRSLACNPSGPVAMDMWGGVGTIDGKSRREESYAGTTRFRTLV